MQSVRAAERSDPASFPRSCNRIESTKEEKAAAFAAAFDYLFMSSNSKQTVGACFVGYVVQAAINNFLPLLFVTFQTEYGITLAQITLLVTLNFSVQLCVDLLSAFFVDRIGYRRAIVTAHAFAAAGFLLLAFLPDLLGFWGLLLCVVVYAIGGGLIEVLVSPIAEACPTKNKTRTMGLLHSFYCWGCVTVVGISTLYFSWFGTVGWRMLALLWAALPLGNLLAFTRVPLVPLGKEGERGMRPTQLLKERTMWLFFLIIFCAGACELAVGQWASAFAERGLGISKTAGDLAGPMLFAALMGISRILYGVFSEKIDLCAGMLAGGVLCLSGYLLIAFGETAVLGLCGVGLSGFAVGILWPATFSLAARRIEGGGTAMFALLALGGDLGCSAGPALAGLGASANGDSLAVGMLWASAFPILLLAALGVLALLLRKRK